MVPIYTETLTDKQKAEINNLWNKEYPTSLRHHEISDLDNFLNGLNDKYHSILVNDSGVIIGWLVTFKREGGTWFSIIVDSEHQGDGLGSKLLGLAQGKEKELNGWVIDHQNDKKQNGLAYIPPLDFYKKNGFHVFEDIRFEKDEISAVKIKWSQD
jgi:GNAT superfamily N-acetyltransferase